MSVSLTHDHLRLLRLRSQRLDPRRDPAGVPDIARAICGVQAQDASAAALAMRARVDGLVVADVERARVDARSAVRTWCMRGTLHLVATEDLGWLLSLFGPGFVPKDRRRRAALGLDEDASIAGVRTIQDALAADGPLSRAEIAERLAARAIPHEGQATIHLIYRAALEGILCLGPDRNNQETYVLLSDWVDLGPAPPLDEASARLARRYLDAYGPAQPDDLIRWSGLPAGELRRAWQRIADDLIEVHVDDTSYWLPKTRVVWLDEPPPPSPIVRLLPRFDPYLLGYRGRDLAVAPQHAKRIHPGGGLLRPSLVIDGRVMATWSHKRRPNGLDVEVEPFEPLPAEIRPGLDAEVTDLGRFLCTEATWRVLEPKEPEGGKAVKRQ